jgi:hypothetical protein
MLINDVVAMLMDVPPWLAAQWGAWFGVGLALSIWARREKSRLVVQRPASGHWSSGSRPAARLGSSGSRPGSSGSRAVVRPVKTVAHTPPSGDAFGELEALFNEVQEGSHRPGEAPVSPEISPEPSPEPAQGEPLRNAPALAAPQSLP